MNNSIIVLLGLLVVLLPFGTSMNAMGIAESEYYTGQYMQYANDMINEYEDKPSYANNDGYGVSVQDSTYENNNYDREYPSYANEHKYKSKDKESSNSVSISKINCNNVNIIGNVNGDISVGNDGREVGTADSNGVLNANNGERYNDGYQKGKDITCIINNNNTIIADGNETTSEPETCEECFTTILEPEEIDALLEILAPNITSLEQFCGILLTPGLPEEQAVRLLIIQTGASPDEVDSLIECLISIGVIFEEEPPI